MGRLVGQWNISGTIGGGSGTKLPVHGTARATVDLSYFVRLASISPIRAAAKWWMEPVSSVRPDNAAWR